MGIERAGPYIEFVADEGTRTLVKISAVQIVAEADPIGKESLLTVGGRIFRVEASLDELRDVLLDDFASRRFVR